MLYQTLDQVFKKLSKQAKEGRTGKAGKKISEMDFCLRPAAGVGRSLSQLIKNPFLLIFSRIHINGQGNAILYLRHKRN
jgi:hypothetical protein